ncbi:hypothetical protein GCM10028805_34050 [Spirosoma harenae]
MGKLFIISLFVLCLACSQSDQSAQQEKASTSSLDGSWELVENRVEGKIVVPKLRPQQFKIFHDGFFSYLMYKPDGSFYNAGAGTYSTKGNQYKETFLYYSDTIYVGSSDWQEWKLEGDTLYFYGFKKAIDKSGRDVTQEWGLDKFVEKRVRAKLKQ